MANTELEWIYAKYVDYLTCLRKDMDRVAGKPVSPQFQARLLSFEDFCRFWENLGNCKAEQDLWRLRFELGYEKVAADFRTRMVAALMRTDAPQTNERIAA